MSESNNSLTSITRDISEKDRQEIRQEVLKKLTEDPERFKTADGTKTVIPDQEYVDRRNDLLGINGTKYRTVWTTVRKGRRVLKADLAVIFRDIRPLLTQGFRNIWNRGVEIHYLDKDGKGGIYKTSLKAIYDKVKADGDKIPMTMADRCRFVQELMG